MTGPLLDTVETDEATPSRVDVAIVGGGIIGMSTALALVQKGLSVLVCEKGRVAAEQSSRNWGWRRVSRRDPREIPLAVEASRIWPGLNALEIAARDYKRCSPGTRTSANGAALP
jgi:glycine/D-amino acid oxidase-like deaminating enzyme